MEKQSYGITIRWCTYSMAQLATTSYVHNQAHLIELLCLSTNSKCWSERGLIWQSKPLRCLLQLLLSAKDLVRQNPTYDVTPLLHSIFGSTSRPSLSMAFEMLKMAKIFEIFKNKDISAKCAPGHSLLPNPNTNLNGSGCGFSPRWREGSKSKGFEYTSASWAIALRGFD